MLAQLAAVQKISYDDDAQLNHHTLLLLYPSAGAWMSESK
jgi:hypothetical protein